MYCAEFLMHQNHMSLLLLIHNVIHPNDLNILLLVDIVLNNVSVSVYLFVIEKYIKRSQKNLRLRLSWRGSPKEASGLMENGLSQIIN